MKHAGAAGGPGKLIAPDPLPKLLRDIVNERSGVYFENERLDGMLEKQEPPALVLKCQSFLDYYYILKYDENGPEEWRRVMDAFSVQETYFWRELDQIRAFVDHVVPEWFKRSSAPLRIWSAACATGEEPYKYRDRVVRSRVGRSSHRDHCQRCERGSAAQGA